MPRQGWSEDDNAKLKSLAGRIKATEIANQLGRSLGATAVQASKLGISLRYRAQKGRADADNGHANQRLSPI